MTNRSAQYWYTFRGNERFLEAPNWAGGRRRGCVDPASPLFRSGHDPATDCWKPGAPSIELQRRDGTENHSSRQHRNAVGGDALRHLESQFRLRAFTRWRSFVLAGHAPNPRSTAGPVDIRTSRDCCDYMHRLNDRSVCLHHQHVLNSAERMLLGHTQRGRFSLYGSAVQLRGLYLQGS